MSIRCLLDMFRHFQHGHAWVNVSLPVFLSFASRQFLTYNTTATCQIMRIKLFKIHTNSLSMVHAQIRLDKRLCQQ